MHFKQSKNKKSILVVYVSLFLSMILFASSSFAWFTVKDTATISSDDLAMNASAGLRVNEGESISNVITLDNVYLSEVSSVDGRNMFLPTSGNYSSETSDMFFREAGVGDQNQYFAYKNFTLTGDSDVTAIYIKGYNIVVDDQVFNGGIEIEYDSSGKPVAQVKKDQCPVRIAFIFDSAEDPIVIDPTALVDKHVKNYNAIQSITSSGSPITQITDATSFSNHFFSYNNPLVTLHGSESKDVTMVVWLESTAGSEICDRYADKKVSVNIELESNFSDTDVIMFVDDTLPDNEGAGEDGYTWINPNGSCIVVMSYYDTVSKSNKTVVMYEIDETHWRAPIPKTVVTDISFYRFSLEDEIIYNAWYTKEGVNNGISSNVSKWLNEMGKSLEESRGDNLTYTAIHGNGYSVTNNEAERLSPGIGFWDYDNASGGESGGESGGNTGGGNNSGDYYKYGFSVNFEKSWIIQNLKDAGYTMYVVIGSPDDTSGQTADGTAYPMVTDTSNYRRCSVDGLHLQEGSIVKRFELKSKYGHIKPLYLAYGQFSLKLDKGYNYTAIVNNSDKIQIQ